MGRPSDARKRLVRAAVTEIFAHSYGSVSVDDLCSKAEVTKSSFYHFFSSKHDLALASLDAYWQSTQTHVIEPSFATDVAPRERILRFFDLTYEGQRAIWETAGQLRGCLVGNMTLEMSAQDAEFRDKVDSIFTSWIGYFERAVRDGVEQGVFKSADPTITAKALLAYLEGVLLLARSCNDPEVIKQLRGGVLSLLHVEEDDKTR